MCQSCGSNTKISGLKELEGLCITCWRDRANKVQALLDEIELLKMRYGGNLRVAPDSILRIFKVADRARGEGGHELNSISGS